ncbi:hypothetical protein [Methylomonas koyamae]|uniref:hypothetical protein n=1 Tax=Methylomonas koyamae TaxID=702114 RepID=UPI00112DE30A|nr:hypothetical protein [Methylomonas koyamae]TPQ24332.1 hypothetical protein C2U68_20250 [Methylomonas koyamae]
MDANTLISILTLIVLIYLFEHIKFKPITATALDWCVVLRIDKTNKVVHLWFYPILAFKVKMDEVVPITAHTRSMNELLKANKDGSLETYARWLRDGAMLECYGFPDTINFSDLIGNYIFQEYRINFVTSIPDFYLSIINNKQKYYIQFLNESDSQTH